MPEILFIKTSSLGDVIHHMPAVTDARKRFPNAKIAWMVEEAYVPLAKLHPGVDDVIPVAVRRWRKAILKPSTFWKTWNKPNYDAVKAITDPQNRLRDLYTKTCLLTREG